MKIELESTEIFENWSPETELRLLGKPEKLNPHHVPGTRPHALVTIQQGWIANATGLDRITLSIEQGWFDGK